MENKSLRAAVSTNELIFNESSEQPIDIEFTLPDYLPDINRILKCKAVPRISSKGINGSSITVDGCVTVTVIYADEENRLFSYEYQYPFNKSFDTSSNAEGAILKCKTKCEYINCRAVTSRKIDIHGAAGIYIKALKKCSLEILTDYDDCNVELKRSTVPATTPMSYSEKYLIIEEEIEIGQGQPAVCSLLRYEACAVIKESRLINNKVVVKGEMVLTALYSSEQGVLQCVKNNIPFSQLIEMDGINDSCECDTKVEVVHLELKPRVAAGGEARSFSLTAKLLIKSEAYCNNDIEAINDAFCRKFETKAEKKTIGINKLFRNITEVFNCKKNLEFKDNSVESIADLWCEIQNSNYRIDGQQFIVTGIVGVGMIAFDTDNVPTYHEKNIDFEYKYMLPEYFIGEPQCEPQIDILTANYTITGNGNLELRIELSVNAAIYILNNVSLITELEIDEAKPTGGNTNGAMIIYFATGGESVWDIARHYFASVNEIKELNNLNDDKLQTDKMLLIPIN